LLNALNKNYSEAITIYIKYVNLPENRAFSPVPNNKIEIDLTGDGFSLMQLKNSAEEDTVIIDLSTLEFEILGNKSRVQIPTSLIVSELKEELNNNISISRVSRDSVEIITELGSFKDIEIRPNFLVTIKKGMVLKKPVYVIPNTIEIQGPISVLDELTFISTEQIELEGVYEHVEVDLKLAYNARLLNPEYTKVKLIVEVEALTEGEIQVPIQISGLPENKRIRLLPSIVSVKYSTGLSHYDLITPELFDVVIKYEDVIKNRSKIPVYLRTIPSYVNLIQLYPERVGYLKMDVLE
jgi:hypothetical protein